MRSAMLFTAAAAALLFLAPVPAAQAATCTAKDFSDAVDQSGASLRNLTLAAQPKIQERMRRYKEVKKLNDVDYENAALDAIQDSTLTEYDRKSSELLMTVDSLGRVPEGATPDCSKLDEVKAASAELNAVIRAKSEYMLRRLDEKIAEASPGGSRTAAKPAVTPPPAQAQAQIQPPAPTPARPPTQAPVSEKAPKAPSAPKAEKPARPSPAWTADTHPSETKPGEAKPNDAYSPDLAMRTPGGSTSHPPLSEDGYTIDEIRDVTRGFFGTISTNLASVIEHAFKEMGRPSAYVLGTEGGGAFLAGLRFGKGTLYMRNERGTRQVYWHGPSVGTDVGAAGSQTLFLIYRMGNSGDLYRYFTGIDGSAYFVGGVGLTLLKGGPVIMAPIRTGVGMRIGANIGYIRFTEQATWNPF
ncbi:DUF1134 domain-containing protein [Hyphomicrobium methylovorum]|uniref:DUF1134 domain-containing protein n=1 Tax=Hyphomicrobium methylovorum TaxID=84 RepID=UPI0015E7D575|nr:DUF1134 domain-containing protein [Hyphomicrobium methylovorum]MBA2125234.1 DUF1134 domain-containing protein [Hyphomicrobium methylovorum]